MSVKSFKFKASSDDLIDKPVRKAKYVFRNKSKKVFIALTRNVNTLTRHILYNFNQS